jgi:hypothetical protein
MVPRVKYRGPVLFCVACTEAKRKDAVPVSVIFRSKLLSVWIVGDWIPTLLLEF